MDPRKFLNFFKSKTGKIIAFLALIGIGCTVYYGFYTTRQESVAPARTQAAGQSRNQPADDRQSRRLPVYHPKLVLAGTDGDDEQRSDERAARPADHPL